MHRHFFLPSPPFALLIFFFLCSRAFVFSNHREGSRTVIRLWNNVEPIEDEKEERTREPRPIYIRTGSTQHFGPRTSTTAAAAAADAIVRSIEGTLFFFSARAQVQGAFFIIIFSSFCVVVRFFLLCNYEGKEVYILFLYRFIHININYMYRTTKDSSNSSSFSFILVEYKRSSEERGGGGMS